MKTIEDYVDNKNRNLYIRLAEKHQIELNKLEPLGISNDNNWQLNYSQGVFRISYYKDIEQSNFFTHELFHIDLIDNGFSDFPEILPLLKEGKKNYIFLPIIGHLNNVFAHERFYNEFINLGYLPSEFVSDYNTTIDLSNIIDIIENANISSGLPYSDISMYIQYFFTAKDNRNLAKEQIYNELLNYMRTKNTNLYEILNNTWKSWQNSKSLASKDFLNHLFEQTEILLENK